MFTPEPETWYIVVTCDGCKSTIYLFADLTQGKSVLAANYIVTCPRCGHKGGYQGRHYHHSVERQQPNVTSPQAATT